MARDATPMEPDRAARYLVIDSLQEGAAREAPTSASPPAPGSTDAQAFARRPTVALCLCAQVAGTVVLRRGTPARSPTPRAARFSSRPSGGWLWRVIHTPPYRVPPKAS